MRKAQVDLPDEEFAEMSMFRFKKNWTVQRLLRRALLHYIRTDPPDLMEDVIKQESKTKGDSQ